MKHKTKPKGSILVTFITAFCINLISLPANATSCTRLTFEEQIKKSDVVFEGHFLKHELVWFETKNMRNSNFNKPGYYIASETYIADKVWKGINVGDEVTTYLSWPIPREYKLLALADMQDKKYPDKQIYALKKIKISPNDYNQGGEFSTNIFEKLQKGYYSTNCNGEYKPTSENTAFLNKKFPQATKK